ncbi:hypothetical protein [Kinneretia aquatilis]|uniref:hypothetical protein n=1 Tax=Kinneretia aquatilis TaxID=2070761 RepID=UPI0014950DB0|nr:hypothetical protein [Paucibacter aquatile]WIV99681.1 hypothetical protein K9V56_009510 [Paucibacter aquatile]
MSSKEKISVDAFATATQQVLSAIEDLANAETPAGAEYRKYLKSIADISTRGLSDEELGEQLLDATDGSPIVEVVRKICGDKTDWIASLIEIAHRSEIVMAEQCA